MVDRRAKALVIANGSLWSMGWLAAWLPEGGLDLQVVRPFAGEQLPVRVDTDALVVLPGEVGVHDDARAAWQPQLRTLVRRAVDDGVAYLGICYGAQLLTAACGGQVAAGAHGPEFGLVPVTPTPQAATDHLFGGLPDPTPAVLWHHDVTTELPPGAVPLAATTTYPNASYRLGGRAWAVQFHPEATVSGVRRWSRYYAEELWTLGTDPDHPVVETRARRDDLHRVWSAFVVRFAAVALGTAAPTLTGTGADTG